MKKNENPVIFRIQWCDKCNELQVCALQLSSVDNKNAYVWKMCKYCAEKSQFNKDPDKPILVIMEIKDWNFLISHPKFLR